MLVHVNILLFYVILNRTYHKLSENGRTVQVSRDSGIIMSTKSLLLRCYETGDMSIKQIVPAHHANMFME